MEWECSRGTRNGSDLRGTRNGNDIGGTREERFCGTWKKSDLDNNEKRITSGYKELKRPRETRDGRDLGEQGMGMTVE